MKRKKKGKKKKKKKKIYTKNTIPAKKKTAKKCGSGTG